MSAVNPEYAGRGAFGSLEEALREADAAMDYVIRAEVAGLPAGTCWSAWAGSRPR
jgi:hypothetical protein